MNAEFERLERLLSEDKVFLEPSFSLDGLCSRAGARQSDFDRYLEDRFGIDLKSMVMVYVDCYFRQLLGF